MKLRVLSDLHLEFGDFSVPKAEADLVILAGDIHTKENAVQWILRELPEQDVLYVLGNHEYYGEKIPRLVDKLRARFAGTRVRVLEDEVVEFSGYRFFGATLWTDMNLLGDQVRGAAAAMEMNDFKRIRVYPTWKKFRPVDARAFHANSVAKLKEFLRVAPERSVVVTHHAPSIHSVPVTAQEDWIRCAYASNLVPLIQAHQPLLWIHGHIHRAPSYAIGRTRVVSNSRGYPDSANPGFRADLVVDLQALPELPERS